jgi:two-component system NarL family sensor kinase
MTRWRTTTLLLLILGGMASLGCQREEGRMHDSVNTAVTNKDRIHLQHISTNELIASLDSCYQMEPGTTKDQTWADDEEALRTSIALGYSEAAALICRKLSIRYAQMDSFGKEKSYRAQFLTHLNKTPSSFFDPKKQQHRWLVYIKEREQAANYYKSGNFDSAILLYKKLLSQQHPAFSTSRSLMGDAYSAMGAMYATIGDTSMALRYFNQLSALAKRYQDSALLLTGLTNKAALLANYNYSDKALSLALEAFQIAGALSDWGTQKDLAYTIAIAFLQQHKPKEALPYSKLSLKLTLQLNINKESIAGPYNLLGYNYNEMKDFKMALHYLLPALKAALSDQDWQNIENAYGQLTAAYEGLGQYATALEYSRESMRLLRKVRGPENTQKLAQAELRYKVAQKNVELAETNKFLAKNKAQLYQQRYWLIGSISLAIILLLSVILTLRNSRQKRKLHREQLHNLQQQKKIEHLKLKVEVEEEERRRMARELHDGLGVLLSAAKINHTVIGKDLSSSPSGNIAYQESAEILEQMQQEIKTITHNLVPNYISHKNFEEALELSIAKFNQPGTFLIQRHSYGVVQDLHPDRSFSLFRVIEEIINNAAKHARASKLIIQLLYHTDQLHITIEDNGIGFDITENYSGMGLHNIRNRIELLQGYLNLSAQKDKGTTYTIEIPYEYT